MLYDDFYLLEINECNYVGTFYGLTSNTINGVPEGIIGAFRYTNGRIYFITDNNAFEYNEFTNTIDRSLSNGFAVLGIFFIRETIG